MHVFFLMIRRPPRSTLFPTRRSSDLREVLGFEDACQHRSEKRNRNHSQIRRKERRGDGRSEEHTSELQSRQYLVCRLLLEKKNKTEKSEVVTGALSTTAMTTTHGYAN